MSRFLSGCVVGGIVTVAGITLAGVMMERSSVRQTVFVCADQSSGQVKLAEVREGMQIKCLYHYTGITRSGSGTKRNKGI